MIEGEVVTYSGTATATPRVIEFTSRNGNKRAARFLRISNNEAGAGNLLVDMPETKDRTDSRLTILPGKDRIILGTVEKIVISSAGNVAYDVVATV